MASHEIHKRVDDVGAGVVGALDGFAFDVFHQAVEVVARGGDGGDADGGALPGVVGIEFGDRDVEARAQPVFQRAQHLAAVLERARRLDAKLDSEKGDGHCYQSPDKYRMEKRLSRGAHDGSFGAETQRTIETPPQRPGRHRVTGSSDSWAKHAETRHAASLRKSLGGEARAS